MTRVKIGKCYIARLTKGEAPVRIESTHEDGGWVAKTLLTSRITRIKTKEQIVREYDPDEPEEVVETILETEPVEETPAEVNVNEWSEESETEDIYVSLRRKPRSPMTLLDAAHRVLSEYGGDLNAREIVEAAVEKGYWVTGGKTPANTLNAAIAREIKIKGEESRFAKQNRGRFVAHQS